MNVQLPPCVGDLGDPDLPEKCSGRNAACACLHCHPRFLTRTQHVFLQKDRATQVHWVRSGLLRIYQTLADGERQIIGFAFPGEFVDLAADGEYRFCAQAVTQTELRSMPRTDFKAAALADPRFAYQLFAAVSGQLSRSADLAVNVGRRSAEASLAAFLLEMHRRIANADPRKRDIHLPMPRTDIADYLGLTPETISRLFTRFAERDFIAVLNRRGIELKSLDALHQLAEGFAPAGFGE